jgi:hypothetical protein
MHGAVVVLVLSACLLFGTAVPAVAHGGGGTDATNFLSTIQGVSKAASDGEPAEEARVAGVAWRVIAGDAMLEVTNTSSQELTIPGYEGEPYLRISNEGVYRNENSPATYLNEDRFGAEVPEEASAKADAKWEKISDDSKYYWHEHRIHWMSASLPPQVASDQGSERVIFDWIVPFFMDQESFVLSGQLKWIPPLKIWPWLLGALVLTTLPMVGALVLRGDRRRRYLLKVGSGTVVLFAILGAVHSLDDLIAVPASALENVFAASKVLPFVIAGLIAGLWAWRGRTRPALAMAIGAGAISMGIGIAHVFALSNSQLASTLPELFSRVVFAGTMVLILPVGAAAWLARPSVNA